jgi:hypothetical protein
MSIVYLIKGHTGEYEDSIEWIAKAFKSKVSAQHYYKQLLNVIHTHNVKYKGADSIEIREALERKLEALDPLCRIDYNGVYYEITEVKVL